MNQTEAEIAHATESRRSAGSLGRLAQGFGRMWRSMVRHYEIAATRRVLVHLDSHILKDIGLSHGELQTMTGSRLGQVIEQRGRHRNLLELSRPYGYPPETCTDAASNC